MHWSKRIEYYIGNSLELLSLPRFFEFELSQNPSHIFKRMELTLLLDLNKCSDWNFFRFW